MPKPNIPNVNKVEFILFFSISMRREKYKIQYKIKRSKYNPDINNSPYKSLSGFSSRETRAIKQKANKGKNNGSLTTFGKFKRLFNKN
jgi:hypothetical protein